MEDLGERTEEATPRRLKEARDEGHVARSPDFAAALVLLGGALLVWAGVEQGITKLAGLLRAGLGGPSEPGDWARADIGIWSWAAVGGAVRIGLPLLIGAWLIACASHVVQVGWMFAPAALQPRVSRINPISGWRRIFGTPALVKAGMDAAKVVAVFGVVAHFARARMNEILILADLELGPASVVLGGMLLDLAVRLALVLLLLGAIDLAWQKWKHRRDLRMNRVEIREELRQTEGDPGTRRRRQRVQQQVAMQRLTTAVPQAHVVVTNRAHISIAIRYDERTMRAPRIVAKGQDLRALRIQEIAGEHGIPVIERKPLARALYRSIDVGQEITSDHYRAVAEIIATALRSPNLLTLRASN